jgi:multidrug resistance efflux pump
MLMNISSADARANIEHAERRIRQLQHTIRLAEYRLWAAEKELIQRRAELVRAAAAEASNALPVGTRVAHYRWQDITGTVVESDGTGIAVQQDGQTAPSFGFGIDEWVVI